jgi:hypothetical protein
MCNPQSTCWTLETRSPSSNYSTIGSQSWSLANPPPPPRLIPSKENKYSIVRFRIMYNEVSQQSSLGFSLPECGAASLLKRFPTASEPLSPERLRLQFPKSGTTSPLTQCHIPEGRNDKWNTIYIVTYIQHVHNFCQSRLCKADYAVFYLTYAIYSDSLRTLTSFKLAVPQFQPLILSVLIFALSNIANISVPVFLYCLWFLCA